MAVHAAQLDEPDFGPPTKKYDFDGPLVPGTDEHARHEDRRHATSRRNHPILTTDFFEFGTSSNGLEQIGAASRWAMRCSAWWPRSSDRARRSGSWFATHPIRRSTATCRERRRRRHAGALGGLVLRDYGYWTSVMSAIATWAMIAPS